MNVTAHQQKKKNEETRRGKRKVGEERKQVIDSKEAVCCPFAVLQGAAQRKNKWGLPGLTGTLERSAYYRYCCPELATVLSGVTFFYNSANESCAKFFKSSCSWRKVHPLLK